MAMRGLRDLRGSYPEVGALAGELQSPQAAAADPALARLRAPGPAPAAAVSHVASLDDSDRPRGITRRLRSSGRACTLAPVGSGLCGWAGGHSKRDSWTEADQTQRMSMHAWCMACRRVATSGVRAPLGSTCVVLGDEPDDDEEHRRPTVGLLGDLRLPSELRARNVSRWG